MAKGKNCPYCNKVMYAKDEKKFPAGVEVIYYCSNCDFNEKFFEGLSKRCPDCNKEIEGTVEKYTLLGAKVAYYCLHCNAKH